MSASVWVLPEQCTVANLAMMQDGLQDLLSAGDDVSVDAEELREVDTAGLQIIYMAEQALKAEGYTLRWRSVPENLKRIVDLGGFGALFDEDAHPSLAAEVR